jgi:hypothetical protein
MFIVLCEYEMYDEHEDVGLGFISISGIIVFICFNKLARPDW